MKIAFLNIYGGTNNRGAESFADKLGALLSDRGYKVDFYTGKQVGMTIVQPVHNVNNPLKRFFLDSASLSVLKFTLKVLPELKGYDWVIPMNGFWQVLLCKFLPGKILITGHSGPGWDERWNLLLKPDVFVATTRPTAEWASRACPWTKVATIPYGVDIATFAKAKPVKLDLERPVVLCPAAAVPYKRVDLAIKAVAAMSKGSLVHLGTGPEIEEIRKLGESLLGKRFLTKSVDYTKIPGYYAACDSVTLPSSEQENSPMVFLESLAAGKTCITTDAPRPRWILGDAGVFVDPENTDEYALALQKTVAKEIITSRAKKYSWQRIIEEYERLLSASPR